MATIRLGLLRDGKAGDAADWSADDRQRPLTDAGREELRSLLAQLGAVLRFEQVWTSPWLRARQSAELAAAQFDAELHEQTFLAGDVGDAEQRCAALARAAHGLDRVLLVGHEPSLGELLGFLCAAPPIPLKKAGLALLRGEAEAGGMRLRALLPPKLLTQGTSER